MLDAALKYLVTLAQQATIPKPIDIGDPSMIGHLVGDEIKAFPVANPREHIVKSVDEIVSLAKRFNEEIGEHVVSSVWFSESKVTLLIDDDGKRANTVDFHLETSDVFTKLIALSKHTQPVDQKEFIRLLRVDLAGTLEPVALLEKVRTIKFSTTQDVASVKKAQSESLGKEIRSKVETDAGALPEEITLMAPVFKSFGMRRPVPIRCAVEVFPTDGTFRLKPLPDEIEKAQQEAVRRIAERLVTELPESVPAYYGTP